jgi:hypothetical protein
MEYIKKTKTKFLVLKSNALVQVNNSNLYESRVNYQGWGGKDCTVWINEFSIEWLTNFGFGSWNKGTVYISFRKIFIREINNVNSTKRFVELLNQVLNITENEKDKIIVELAERLAIFRELSEHNHMNTIFPSNNPKFLKPNVSIEELSYINKSSCQAFQKIIHERDQLLLENESYKQRILQVRKLLRRK